MFSNINILGTLSLAGILLTSAPAFSNSPRADAEQQDGATYVNATIRKLDKTNQQLTFVDDKGFLKTYNYDIDSASRHDNTEINKLRRGQKVILKVVAR